MNKNSALQEQESKNSRKLEKDNNHVAGIQSNKDWREEFFQLIKWKNQTHNDRALCYNAGKRIFIGLKNKFDNSTTVPRKNEVLKSCTNAHFFSRMIHLKK